MKVRKKFFSKSPKSLSGKSRIMFLTIADKMSTYNPKTQV